MQTRSGFDTARKVEKSRTKETEALLSSPLPLVIEYLPLSQEPDALATLFLDQNLPMRAHEGDLLARVLEKEVGTFGVGPLCTNSDNDRTDSGHSTDDEVKAF